jgi:2-hydroxychromene-2-carboxylate isomerase
MKLKFPVGVSNFITQTGEEIRADIHAVEGWLEVEEHKVEAFLKAGFTKEPAATDEVVQQADATGLAEAAALAAQKEADDKAAADAAAAAALAAENTEQVANEAPASGSDANTSEDAGTKTE